MSQDELPQDELSRDGLSPCKVCGEEVPVKWVREGSWWCPECLVYDPHGFHEEEQRESEQREEQVANVLWVIIGIIILMGACFSLTGF